MLRSHLCVRVCVRVHIRTHGVGYTEFKNEVFKERASFIVLRPVAISNQGPPRPLPTPSSSAHETKETARWRIREAEKR